MSNKKVKLLKELTAIFPILLHLVSVLNLVIRLVVQATYLLGDLENVVLYIPDTTQRCKLMHLTVNFPNKQAK